MSITRIACTGDPHNQRSQPLRQKEVEISVKHRQPPAIRNPIPCKKQKNEEPPSPPEIAREEIERHEEQIARLQADVL